VPDEACVFVVYDAWNLIKGNLNQRYNMKYSKPSQLSCPCSYPNIDDMFARKQTLNKILDQKTEELTIADYNVLFAKFLPAANYEEGCYFLDYCFEYIEKQNSIHDSFYPNSLLWWVDSYRQNFKNDFLWDEVIHRIKRTLFILLDTFRLFKLSKKECDKIGRNYDYSIGPYNSVTLCDIFDDLTIYDSMEDILWEVVSFLEHSDKTDHCRWYVELAYHSRSWCLFYDETDELDNYIRKEKLFHKLHTFKTLGLKEEVAIKHTLKEGKYKYNKLVSL